MFQHSVAPWCFKAALCNKVSTLFYVCAGIRQSVDIIIHLCICPAKCWHHVGVLGVLVKRWNHIQQSVEGMPEWLVSSKVLESYLAKCWHHRISVHLSSKVLTSCQNNRLQEEEEKKPESSHVGAAVQQSVDIIIYLCIRQKTSWHHVILWVQQSTRIITCLCRCKCPTRCQYHHILFACADTWNLTSSHVCEGVHL